MSDGRVSDKVITALARLVQWLVAAGGTVVLPAHDDLLRQAMFQQLLGLPPEAEPTLAFGQRPRVAGCHIMQTPSVQWTEMLTGLGATGVEVMLALVGSRPEAVVGSPLPGHPLIPLLQVAEENVGWVTDLDAVLVGDVGVWADQLLELLLNALSRKIIPTTQQQGNIDFQITRGITGVSL